MNTKLWKRFFKNIARSDGVMFFICILGLVCGIGLLILLGYIFGSIAVFFGAPQSLDMVIGGLAELVLCIGLLIYVKIKEYWDEAKEQLEREERDKANN